ncbi:hypothetical protein W97_04376 [Coniosporium apollinis CBS 100218]|uniref:Methylated-DNA--protein-cysteine methyltransferase n=1 Tax=Coniosporium apollinis (strain CBS 100218) TaxID=1168221 RepID=R7YTK9_CONA1|nr:uncharacterized protein W97_04376 [Coniosporium apollinis CBS 100218]EON65139.1 hypothetical protein W97_04376 [Coniosporium apollinis CBS 100218]
MAPLHSLQDAWTEVYRKRLPALAAQRDPAQKLWPVHLDHCFARVVLDNAIGKDRPWTEVVKAPAVKNMSEMQLQAALSLADDIATGRASLVALNQTSLALRSKASGASSNKRHASEVLGDDGLSRPSKTIKKAVVRGEASISRYFTTTEGHAQTPPQDEPEDLDFARRLIAEAKDLTPFRKETLTLLTLVPRGRYTTYGAMSDYISRTHHPTCARAVGNAMRNNPFAPQVPCHRVLAHNGRIGGFGGDWGEDGKHADQKRKLLAEEGVRFDVKGKVFGAPFKDFDLVQKRIQSSSTTPAD